MDPRTQTEIYIMSVKQLRNFILESNDRPEKELALDCLIEEVEQRSRLEIRREIRTRI